MQGLRVMGINNTLKELGLKGREWVDVDELVSNKEIDHYFG